MRYLWDEEADERTWVHTETMLDCAMRRNRVRAWCGYVGVPRRHILYGLEYWPLCSMVDAHGLNYGYPGDGTYLQINRWWFGFDCDHHCDIAPAEYEEHGYAYGRADDASYWTEPEVVQAVEWLATQVAEIAACLSMVLKDWRVHAGISPIRRRSTRRPDINRRIDNLQSHNPYSPELVAPAFWQIARMVQRRRATWREHAGLPKGAAQ